MDNSKINFYFSSKTYVMTPDDGSQNMFSMRIM